MTATMTTKIPRITSVTIMGVRLPATGPMLGVFFRSSPTAPDIWSAFGGVSPGCTPLLPSPAVTAGSGSPLSLVFARSS
jgi:hypothetical protein